VKDGSESFQQFLAGQAVDANPLASLRRAGDDANPPEGEMERLREKANDRFVRLTVTRRCCHSDEQDIASRTDDFRSLSARLYLNPKLDSWSGSVDRGEGHERPVLPTFRASGRVRLKLPER